MKIIASVVLLVALVPIIYATVASHGYTPNNDRLSDDTLIKQDNINRLSVMWNNTLSSAVSITATVFDNMVVSATFGGDLIAFDKSNGNVIWRKLIFDFTNITGSLIRSTPAYENGRLVFGSQQNGYLYCITANSGDLIWKTQLTDHVAARTTQSPTIVNGVIYIGTGSREEQLGGSYKCCTFQGSMFALYLENGTILWETKMLPDNGRQTGGFAGASSKSFHA
jgi:polyvinyl alcohol dehydrogenase (cytochrome)